MPLLGELVLFQRGGQCRTVKISHDGCPTRLDFIQNADLAFTKAWQCLHAHEAQMTTWAVMEGGTATSTVSDQHIENVGAHF